MSNKYKPPRYRADIRFQNRVRESTYAALQQKELDFAKAHKQDTDEQLIAYLRAFADELGRTPNVGEIIGGRYIASRFQGWEHAVSAAKLAMPGKAASTDNRLIYKMEYKRQEKLVREAHLAEKREGKALRQQKNAEGQKKVQEQQESDRLWGLEHESDTDEQLIKYVQETADRLGYSPLSREVLGATYIAKRIGSWALVLHLAGLPMPKGVEAPNPKTLKVYLQRRDANTATKR